MKVKTRLRAGLIIVGTSLMVLCAVAQTSSRLTPALSRYPVVLAFFGSAGTAILLIGAICFLLAGIRFNQALYFRLAGLAIAVGLYTQLSIWGKVFQFGLAGLTIGGGLILLGSAKSHFICKKNA